MVDMLHTFLEPGVGAGGFEEQRQALVKTLRESLGQGSNAALERMILHGKLHSRCLTEVATGSDFEGTEAVMQYSALQCTQLHQY